MAVDRSRARNLARIFGTGVLSDLNDSVAVGNSILDASLDSAEVIAIIDSAYIAARTTAGTDSAAIINLIDSAYVQSRQITYNTSNFADSAFVTSQINALIDGAPGTLNTLNEIAAALNDDDSAYNTLLSLVNAKSDLDSADAIQLIDSSYIQSRQTTYDFLDSSEAISLIDSAYVQARQITATTTYSLSLHQQGTLETLTGSVRWYAPSDLTFSKITARIGTVADNTVTAVINKNGTSTVTLNIATSSTSATDNTGFSMSEGDYLTVDVTSVGSSSNPGENLNVQFVYTLD